MFKKDDTGLNIFQKISIWNKKLPWFNALFKLGLYFIFFVLIFVVFIGISVFSGIKSKYNTQDTTVIKYQDVLDKLLDNSRYVTTININGKKYIATCEYGNNILTGVYETADGTYKFKIKENKIYELHVDEEVANEHIFDGINYKLLLNDYIIELIKSNSGIKVEEDEMIKYKYETIKINEESYKMEVDIKQNKVINIKIFNDNTTYDIKYE